ncbi:MAG: hypothetical protein GY696_28795 [Gammaproteobacteria bacterium]|nr:hypothetical protein [Gammaproteobacteria bacterium]
MSEHKQNRCISDDEVLSAMLDGALSSEEKSILEQRLSDEPALQRRLDCFQQSDQLLRSAMNSVLEKELPESLAANMQQKCSLKAEKFWSFLHWPQAVFGSLLGLVLLGGGFLGGYQIADDRVTQNFSIAAEQQATIRAEVRAALGDVLESTPSGKMVQWRHAATGAEAELLAVRTLKAGDKRFCREFREVLVIDGKREIRHGLSCREGVADWQPELFFSDTTTKQF